MKILLFLAKGFETMEFSVFVDVMGWARNAYIKGTNGKRQSFYGILIMCRSILWRLENMKI